MENEEHVILDEDLISDKRDQRPDLVNWTSLIILWIGVLISIAYVWYWDIERVIVVLLLVISTLATYIKYKWGTVVTFVTILLGVFSIIQFFFISYTYSFGTKMFQISLEIILLTIGLIHYATNRERMKEVLVGSFKIERSEEEAKAYQRVKIDRFKERYKDKGIHELKMLVENKGLLPEARAAVKELLESIEDNQAEH